MLLREKKIGNGSPADMRRATIMIENIKCAWLIKLSARANIENVFSPLEAQREKIELYGGNPISLAVGNSEKSHTKPEAGKALLPQSFTIMLLHIHPFIQFLQRWNLAASCFHRKQLNWKFIRAPTKVGNFLVIEKGIRWEPASNRRTLIRKKANGMWLIEHLFAKLFIHMPTRLRKQIREIRQNEMLPFLVNRENSVVTSQDARTGWAERKWVALYCMWNRVKMSWFPQGNYKG